jgi:ABC-type phosphate transport system permease subunit
MRVGLVKTLTFIVLVVFLLCESYEFGRKNGCHDLIKRLNSFGFNRAKEGIGLSDWAWCDVRGTE